MIQAVEASTASASYSTFAVAAEDMLRLAAPVRSIKVDGVRVERDDRADIEGQHYSQRDVKNGGVVVTLYRSGGRSVVVDVS